MQNFFTACLSALLTAGSAVQAHQSGEDPTEPAVIYLREQLPAGTPVMLELAQTVTTQGGRWKESDAFNLIVSEDVVSGNHVVIPRGTLAFGHVRWATGRGAFGKSGKIEVEIDHLLLGGRKIGLTGVYREEGRGALTSAGTVMAAGPLAGFIMGESGEIPHGSLLKAYLAENLGFVIPYRPMTRSKGGSVSTMLRSRQISVKEAFEAAPQAGQTTADKKDGPTRVTVAEAFKEELSALDDVP